MNYFDIIFVIIIAWAAYRGFSKGFIYQAATLAALFFGIYGAVKFSDVVSRFMAIKFNITSEYLPLIAFAITFILIVIIMHLLGKMLEKLVKAVALSSINKLLGVVFSIAKSVFIISIILTGIDHINKNTGLIPEEKIEKSLLYLPIAKVAPAVFPYLHFDELKQSTSPTQEIEEQDIEETEV